MRTSDISKWALYSIVTHNDRGNVFWSNSVFLSLAVYAVYLKQTNINYRWWTAYILNQINIFSSLWFIDGKVFYISDVREFPQDQHRVPRSPETFLVKGSNGPYVSRIECIYSEFLYHSSQKFQYILVFKHVLLEVIVILKILMVVVYHH